MTSPQTLVPEIRFEGFSSAWEQRRLSELANFSRGNGLSWADVRADGANECILYGNLYTDYGMIADSVKYRTNTMPSNPAFSQYGDVLIPGSDTTPTGLARATSIEKSGVLLGGDINILRPTEKVDGSCLSIANKAELIKLIKGITVRHIHNDDIKDVEIAFPVAKDEQRKLVGVFKTIDYLISLQQRKQNQLKNVKKSMLEKMFPRDGANVPEIRFAGFTNAWEQRKLSDLAEIVGGGTPDTNNSAYWDGDIDWYAPAEMEGQRYAKGSVRKITELGLQKSSAKILPAHRTVLFTSRAGIGKMAILQRSAATNQGFQSLVLKDGTDPYFIYSMGEKIKDMAEGVASGSTFLEISGKMLGNLEVMVPNLKEQESIATFFRSIDDLITLHQCKCDKLKDLKNSLLQKMFV